MNHRRSSLVRLTLGACVLATLLALPVLIPAQPNKTALAQVPQTVSGWFDIIWGDSQKGELPSQTLYLLTTQDGQTVALEFGESLPVPFDQLRALRGQLVVVEGEWVNSEAPSEGFVAKTIQPATGAAPEGVEVTGSQPWVTILCKFNDVAAEPKPPSYFLNMYGSAYPGMDHYWREQSFDLMNVVGSAASSQWFTLPQPRAYYVYNMDADPEVEFDITRATTDCTGVADSSVYFPTYVGINMMFNANLDGYAWGGSRYLTLDSVTRIWYATWEPPWGYQDITVIAHEMGHGFGLPHSSGNYGQTYDNQWDVMSDTWSNCGSSSHPTFGCLGQHTISYHKNLEGWIGALRAAVPLYSQATLTLEQLALPPAGNYLMAQIPINGSSTLYYTVEARRNAGYDVKLPGQAVIIHEVNTSRGIPAHVVDIDGNGNTGDSGAQWLVGETFADATNGIQVSIDSATDTGFVVTICNDCNQPTPTPTDTPTDLPTPTNTPTDTPTPTDTATPTDTPPYVQRVNSGSTTAYTDSTNQVWAADRAYGTTGPWGYTAGKAASSSNAVANTTQDPLYQKYRELAGEYRFQVPNGIYYVTLKFAEFAVTNATDRRMNITMEGVRVATDFSVWQQAGPNTALDRTYMTTVSDNLLTIAFARGTSARKDPAVSAIEVVENLEPTPTPTATPTETPTDTPTATPTATPTPTPTPGPNEYLYLSTLGGGTVGGISFADEDIVAYYQYNRTWSWIFDGSDVGMSGDIDAITRLTDGSLLLSFDAAFNLMGVGAVDDSDVIRFVPTSLGATTAGTASMVFDGSLFGLTTNDEDIDAFGLTPDGKLVASTLGAFSVPGPNGTTLSGLDEDLLLFTPTVPFAYPYPMITAGTWALYFDGSDVGLSESNNEDLNGVWIDSSGKLYLSTLGAFSLPNGIAGDGSDVFVCTPGSLGNNTTCTYDPILYWDGSARGLSNQVVDGFDIVR